MAEQRKKKKNKGVFFILIAFALIVYCVMQWYLINRNKIETVKANEGYLNDSILTMGIVCREESIIENISDGHFYYNVENGNRVSSGMLIGEVYNSEEDINNIIESSKIEKQILNLEEAENFMASVNVDISITRRQLSNSMVDFSTNITAGKYNSAEKNVQEMLLSINKINVAMHREGNMAAAKEELKNKNNEIKSRISAPVQSVYSPTSGYFMGDVDGYESIANVDNFKNITYAEGADILMHPIEQANGGYGKMITDYKWSMCAYVTAEQAEKLYEGMRVKLSLDSQENEYHTVTVESLVPKDDMVLVIFRSNTMNKQAASARIVDGEILFSQYKGIKIPKSAIRIVNGEMGVYVKFSKLVIFKRVTPIYQDDNYVILPMEVSEGNEVELYDDIIVKGVNLYDGKYL